MSPPSISIRVASPLAAAERRLIEATLDYWHGHKVRTAKTLGISLKTLYNKLERYRSAS